MLPGRDPIGGAAALARVGYTSRATGLSRVMGTRIAWTGVGDGEFFCPGCGGDRNYQRLTGRRRFTFLGVPVLPRGETGPVVECAACRHHYATDVLDHPTTTRFSAMLRDAVHTVALAVLAAGGACSRTALTVAMRRRPLRRVRRLHRGPARRPGRGPGRRHGPRIRRTLRPRPRHRAPRGPGPARTPPCPDRPRGDPSPGRADRPGGRPVHPGGAGRAGHGRRGPDDLLGRRDPAPGDGAHAVVAVLR